MIEALIGGERDPEVLADMALTRMRSKIGDLREALVGRFGAHHGRMARFHLDHIDYLTGQIDRLDTNIDDVIRPFTEAVRLLKTIPGVGDRTAQVVIAEIGTDMTRFPSAGHLASWAGLCPGNHESAGKSKSGKARKGNAAIRTALCEAAWVAARTKNTYLSAQYRRFRRRFGTKSETKAIFAVAHTMIGIVWHVLAENVEYNELGEDYFNGRNETQQRVNRLVAELRRLGQTVTIEQQAA